MALSVLVHSAPVHASGPFVTIDDALCDEVARPTDPGADGPYDPEAHRLIDLQMIKLGKWTPIDPASDPFSGSFALDGEFVRLDLKLEGLVNPPGSSDPLAFDPFAYGDHPVYGFVEIDVDDDNNTGGELFAPQYHYLGNIVRFGGTPSDQRFTERVADGGSAFDQDFTTKPWVERHGEEFHLALLGSEFGSVDVIEVSGNGDLLFDAGETWDIWGTWFHRAHGFEPFSVALGGEYPGQYVPGCDLRFRHHVPSDTTVVSVVFPLTNTAAALRRGEAPESYDNDPSNQASVEEALLDLKTSALIVYLYGTGDPEEQIILGWKDKDAADFLDPTAWRVTALLGSSYTTPDPAGEFFVWTDVYPDVIRGDVNGENANNNDDQNEIESYIQYQDASDGVVDGRVTLLGFAADFSVFDVNHDGQVDSIDVMLVADEGDCDDDGDVDLADFRQMQTCFSGSGAGYATQECALLDFDADGDVDLKDMRRFEGVLTGPGAS